MKNSVRVLAGLALGTLMTLGTPASAVQYSNASAGTIYSFGSPDTTSYGQVFTAPGGSLDSWSFYDSSSNAGGAEFVVAAWDGSRAVGPALFSALTGDVTGSGGFFSHTYSGINLGLTAGQNYIAYLTTAGVASPVSGVTFSGSDTSPLGGGFRFLNSGGVDPLTLSSSWSDWNVPNTQYSASFAVPSGVPEPATWAMMLLGFGAISFAMRRKRTPVLAHA